MVHNFMYIVCSDFRGWGGVNSNIGFHNHLHLKSHSFIQDAKIGQFQKAMRANWPRQPKCQRCHFASFGVFVYILFRTVHSGRSAIFAFLLKMAKHEVTKRYFRQRILTDLFYESLIEYVKLSLNNVLKFCVNTCCQF